MDVQRLPLLSTDIPGTGGILRSIPEDFRVDEIPAYHASGEGDHVFVRIEKRSMTTFDAIAIIARAASVEQRDVGSAGMKDRHAVTTQWLSVPPPATPESLQSFSSDGLRVLETVRHPHKLRTGHLRGNRFRLRVRQLIVSPQQALERAEAVLAQLSVPPGSPNWYGQQRFGRQGSNVDVGMALVRGGPLPGRSPRGRKRRLFISAAQSSMFNDWLERRISDGLYRTVLLGDVLTKSDTGGMFECEAPTEDQERLDRGELRITGPMFGHKMRTATADSPAAEREQAILESHNLTLESFRPLKKLATGTRRHASVGLGATSVMVAEDSIEVGFELTSGAYATSVMREILKIEQVES